jgi:hypothetical protein
MTKIRKIKEKKIKKEVIETRFKEVKPGKGSSDSETKDTNLENEVSPQDESSSVSSRGTRTAPVLRSENREQTLERTTQTSPASRTETNSSNNTSYVPRSGGANLGYEGRSYVEKNYEPEEKRAIIRETSRPAGALAQRMPVVEMPSTPRTMQQQPAEWQRPVDLKQIMPENKDYELAEQSRKRMPFERKRRAM